MTGPSEDDLWDMSDEELVSAFKEAQASAASPETDIEETEDTETTELDTPEEESEEVVDEDIEEDVEELPEEDSEEDVEEEITDDTTDEDEIDSEEEILDEGTFEDDVPSSEDESAAKNKVQPPQVHKFKANGKEYEFTGQELVEQFPKVFGQAMDYTKKMQAIKPWRKTIDALDQAKLSHDDVSLMIDVLKGDKTAITEVLQRTGVDTLDLDTEENSHYVAKSYGRDAQAIAIQDVVDTISQDPEYKVTHGILSNDWDDRSWQTVSQNPEMIRLLHQDVKSGMYQQLQPMAEKVKVFSGGTKSDLDCYKEAAQQFFQRKAAQEAVEKRNVMEKAEATRLQKIKAETAQRKATKKASMKRKAAAPTAGTRAGSGVIDYLDDSDEAFDEWYKNLQDSM